MSDFELLDVTHLSVPTLGELQKDKGVIARRQKLLGRRLKGTAQDLRSGAITYHATDRLRTAINTALVLEMPLLLAGEPGTGKTQVAWFLAAAFGLGDPLVMSVKSTSKAKELLYSFDAVGDFKDSQEKDTVNRARHVRPGPLWTALTSRLPRVILVDEVDKAPRDFTNDLLDVLDRFEFNVPELERIPNSDTRGHFKSGLEPRDGQWWVIGVRDQRRPIVVLTTNSEQKLPEAFLRRCVFHIITFDEGLIRRILKTRADEFKDIPPSDQDAAIGAFMDLRKYSLHKKPSTAEFLSWMRLLAQQPRFLSKIGGSPGDLPFLSALIKTRADLETLRALPG